MRILFIGFGTVGQGLAELLIEKEEQLARRYDLEVEVVGIADSLKGFAYDPDGLDLQAALDMVRSETPLSALSTRSFSGDALEMIQTAAADAMLEATYTDIKTGEPATSHIRQALNSGMHVATSNKGPVALHYRELEELALENGVRFLFEGTVMSGTPVLNLIRETLAGSDIKEIKGILNGTTNYILSRMEAGLSYEEAVPDADVLGWDALAKVTILAKVVFGATGDPFDYPCEGITEIGAAAIADAGARGKRFKLIGRVWREGDSVKAAVAPEEVELGHPLAGVMGASNAITFVTDTLGEVTVVGPGAGRRETGFSLLNDLIQIAK